MSVNPTAKSEQIKDTREPGQKMPDGTYYAGSLPETGEELFVTPAYSSIEVSSVDAPAYASDLNKLKVCGHDDWEAPNMPMLKTIFNSGVVHQMMAETGVTALDLVSVTEAFNKYAANPLVSYMTFVTPENKETGRFAPKDGSTGTVVFTKGMNLICCRRESPQP